MVKQLALAILLCSPVTAHCQSLPSVPDSVETQIGYIPVKHVETPCGEPKALGCFNIRERILYIQLGLTRIMDWKVYLHELAHIRLFDARIQFQDNDLEERVVDLWATLWLHDLLVRANSHG